MDMMQSMLETQTWSNSLLRQIYGRSLCLSQMGSDTTLSSIGIHLAVFREPYLSFILDGRKTVESRFSINRCAPYKQVACGDLVLLKKSSGPIVAACRIDYVWDYELDPAQVSEIKEEFAMLLCADGPKFWEERAKAQFATLMRVRDVLQFEPLECEKKDRRGWVVLQEREKLPFDVENI